MFGRYELLERIGVGGMAEVWRARVAGVGGFEKILVLKKILPAFASNKTFIEMLLAEARLCAVLQHTNIVQTYENGEIDGQFYIAMEYVPGYDLFKVLSRATQVGRRLPVEMCLFIAAEVAKGLAYAHNAKDNDGRPLNIIHRDVSPSNILISEAGEVKVMDFGVARATLSGQQTEGQSRAGVLKGKLGYMSPEQVTGQPFDHRSDVFSLGIILYESMTLKRLFLGRTDLETLVNIRDARIEHKFRKHSYIEESVRAILRMALSRGADQRYDTALDLHDDIVNLLFEWKIQVTTRSLAAFLAELFDDSGKVAAAKPRRRKSALAPPEFIDGDADSVAFSPDEVKRQAALIKERRDHQRRATSEEHQARSADLMNASRPTVPSAVGGGRSDTSPRTSDREPWSDEQDGAGGGGGIMAPGAVRSARDIALDPHGVSTALTETFDDRARPGFGAGARDITSEFEDGNDDSDSGIQAPGGLRDSRLRVVPLGDGPQPQLQAPPPPAANGQRRFHVRTGDGKVLGPVDASRVEGMIRTRAVGPGAPIQVESGAFQPIEEVTGLRHLLAEVVPDRPLPERHGVLSRMDVPKIIFELHSERASGCLELRHSEAVKFLYLRRGRPQHIASNQKSEMLGPFLVAQGSVSQTNIDLALHHVEQQGGRLGDVLVGLNMMKPYQLYQVLEKQFRTKFIDIFGWDESTYAFYEGDQPPDGTVPLDLDPIAALTEGVRTKLTFALLEPWFAEHMDRAYYRSRNPQMSAESMRFQARETKALSAIMSCQTLRQALNERARNRQQRLATLHVMFLMLQTGLLTYQPEA